MARPQRKPLSKERPVYFAKNNVAFHMWNTVFGY